MAYKCLFCGSELILSSTELCADHSDNYEGDSALIHNLTCPHCGRDYEIWEPTKEERETTFKEYWDGDKG